MGPPVNITSSSSSSSKQQGQGGGGGGGGGSAGKTKTRVGVLLRESVGGKNKSSNQSADLQNLSQKYQVWCKKIRTLIESLQAHHETMKRVHSTRAAVAGSFASMTKDTPMWESCGMLPSANRPSDTVCSYSSVHDVLGAKSLSYAEKYKQFVIDYAVEWEKVVTERVNSGLKKSELLRRELDHYQKKVEAMRLSVNQAMAKGKSVKSDQQEKLRRNEEKLIAAKQAYNNAATDLCILMEEICDRSWRDLHPLMVKVAQFDSTLSNDESKALASLNSVVGKLKEIATANGISPQPRLKDLATLQPELLSTRPGGVAGLAIEAGPSPTGTGSTVTSPLGTINIPSFDNQALTPGSVAPQGLGGFPVQVASSSDNNAYGGGRDLYGGASNALSTSQNSAKSSGSFDPLSSMSMLTISQTAPPPTFDDIYSANQQHRSSIQSAPNSANLPPLAPMTARDPPPRSTSFDNLYPQNGLLQQQPQYPQQQQYGQQQRSPSFGSTSDVDSAFSGYSGFYSAPPALNAAPAPSAPPPPPPSMPPPPPPPSAPGGSLTLSNPSSGYGGYSYGAPPVPSSGNTNPFNY